MCSGAALTPVVALAQGRWYITAGLNPLFDTFDCQEHFFGVPEPGKLAGKINWRIPKGNRDFIERSTVQTFDQVKEGLVSWNAQAILILTLAC